MNETKYEKMNTERLSEGGLTHRAKSSEISTGDLIWLVLKYLIARINLQKLLFLLAFLTYGVGDGVTAAYMMDKAGAIIEINPLVRFMYLTSGFQGVVVIKIWLTFLILFFVWNISRKTNTYWTINGFLSALCIGGMMAMWANIMAAQGATPPSASSIIMTFLALTVLFVLIGDQMDKIHSSDKKSHTLS